MNLASLVMAVRVGGAAASPHHWRALTRTTTTTRGERMPLLVTQGVPTLVFRRESYERAGLTRASLDTRLGLTDTEFQVDGDLVALGPIYDVEALGALVDELEGAGVTYFDDFFEMSGSWPEWLGVSVRAEAGAKALAEHHGGCGWRERASTAACVPVALVDQLVRNEGISRFHTRD